VKKGERRWVTALGRCLFLLIFLATVRTICDTAGSKALEMILDPSRVN
jgi:hypothetical protein